jgi:hypothetical protein
VSLPTAQVQPTTISKINTGVQLLTVAVALGAPIAGYHDHAAFFSLWYVHTLFQKLFNYNLFYMYTICSGLTAVTTVASSLSYAFQRDTYRFEHRSYDHQMGKKLTALAIFILFNVGFTSWNHNLI